MPNLQLGRFMMLFIHYNLLWFISYLQGISSKRNNLKKTFAGKKLKKNLHALAFLIHFYCTFDRAKFRQIHKLVTSLGIQKRCPPPHKKNVTLLLLLRFFVLNRRVIMNSKIHVFMYSIKSFFEVLGCQKLEYFSL